MDKKRIHIICPVRGMTPEQKHEMEEYVMLLRSEGNRVHYPPDSVDQTDPIGYNICLRHIDSMDQSDEVHLFWDINSYGSHFDLGMFFALSFIEQLTGKNGPKLVLVKLFQEDMFNKSYVKVIREIIRRQNQ